MTLPRFSEHLFLRTTLNGCLQKLRSKYFIFPLVDKLHPEFKELSWVFLNSRLHSVAAIERRTIVCWKIAFCKKLYRIETSQCKCKSIDRFLYDTNSFFISWLLVNNKILLGRHHPWEFFFFLRLMTRPAKKKTL